MLNKRIAYSFSRKVAFGSLWVSLTVLIIKGVAYQLTGSVALFSDALERHQRGDRNCRHRGNPLRVPTAGQTASFWSSEGRIPVGDRYWRHDRYCWVPVCERPTRVPGAKTN